MVIKISVRMIWISSWRLYRDFLFFLGLGSVKRMIFLETVGPEASQVDIRTYYNSLNY